MSYKGVLKREMNIFAIEKLVKKWDKKAKLKAEALALAERLVERTQPPC